MDWQKDLPCYGILWNPSPFPFAVWGSRDLNSSYEPRPGISGWSCWKRRKKPPWPPCHHITSHSQAPLGPDQVGRWATETGSPRWEFAAALRFDSVQGLVIPFHQHSCSTLLFLPSPPLHLPWERLLFLQVHQSHKWTPFQGAWSSSLSMSS